VTPAATETIVVTGASSGIGHATARLLAAPSRTLVLMGRNADALGGVAREVEAAGATAVSITLDLTDVQAVQRFTASFDAPVTALVHSAGLASLGTLETLDPTDVEAHMRINVQAPVTLTQGLLPNLRAARGTVVFVNSGAGLRARAGWGAYAASKFALRAVADALREEEGDRLRVTSIYPGRTDTPMQVGVRAQEGGAYEPEAYLTAEDVARSIVHVVEAPAGVSVPDLSVRPS